MPAAFGPDHDVRIDADRNRLRVWRHVERHFDIVEIGEYELTATLEWFEAEAAPEIQQALLRVTVDFAVTFGAAELDARAHHFEGKPCFPEFMSDGKALHFDEVGEIANAQTCGRLVSDIADEMRGRKIVAVEFFVVRTLLLGHVDRAADRHDAHHVVEGTSESDSKLALVLTALISVIDRSARRLVCRSRQTVHIRCELSFESASQPESRGQNHSQAVGCGRAGVNVDV